MKEFFQMSIDSDPVTTTDQNTFCNLQLRDEVREAVSTSGYENPTEIQSAIIPEMLAGRDVLAQSQTGTGKTAAFALPILSQLQIENRTPQVLVLAPTRELAIQVTKAFATYGANLPDFSVAAIYGGQDYEIQFKLLKRGVHVVVGTPGRVIDHINRGTLNLSGIRCLVLDEADEMLNMGFLEDVQFVLQHMPETRQIALFSATLPGPIRDIAAKYLKNPAKITLQKRTMTADSIRQRAVFVEAREKIDVLIRLLEVEETDGVIVFTKTREASVVVADRLCREGVAAVALNGEMPQKTRERTIEKLKSGALDILVATDVAARGLDVTRVSHVVNFDLPQDSESYIHRVGRTGRAGRKGEAFILLSKSHKGRLRAIEKMTRQEIEIIKPPSIEEVNEHRVARFKQKISETIAQGKLEFFEKLVREFQAESEQPAELIAAAIAQIVQGERPFLVVKGASRHETVEDRELVENNSGRGRGRSFDGARGYSDERRGGGEGRRGKMDFRNMGPPAAGMERYRIEVGRADGVGPGNIVGAVANEAGISGSDIGPIKLHDDYSTIDLPKGMPDDVKEILQSTRVGGKQLKIQLLGNESASEERGERRRGKFGSKHDGPREKFGGSRGFSKGKPGGFAKRKSGGFSKGPGGFSKGPGGFSKGPGGFAKGKSDGKPQFKKHKDKKSFA
jgi:ATP-dependent RNA helicase DeaD